MEGYDNDIPSPPPPFCFGFVDLSPSEEIPFSVMVLDKDMNVLAANSQTGSFYGSRPEDLLGRKCYKLRTGELRGAGDTLKPCEDCITYEAAESGRNISRTVERGGVYYQVTALPLESPEGQRMVLEIAEEVSDLVQADLQLRRQRRALSFITEISRWFGKTDPLKTKLKWLLEKLIKEFGFDSGGIYLMASKGDVLKLVCHSGLSEEFVSIVSEHSASGPILEKHREGEVVYFENYSLSLPEDEATGTVIAEGLGTLVSIPLLFEDSLQGVINLAIHGKEPKSEAELRLMGEIGRATGAVVANTRLAEEVITGAEQFRAIVENSTAGIVGFDHLGRIILWNETCKNIYGWKATEILGNRVHDTIAKLAPEEETNAIIKNIFDGKRYPFTEWEDIAADGSIRYTMASKFPLRGTDGDVLMGISTIVDITEQKQSQRTIDELARIIEYSSEAVVVTDLDFKIKFINNAAKRLFGYTLEELQSRHSWELNVDGKPLRDPNEIKKILASGEKYEIEAEQGRKDGSSFWGRRRIEELYDEDGKPVGYVRYTADITAQRMAERRVAFLADIVAQVRDAVIASDKEGRIIYVNKAFEEMFGYELAEIAGEFPFFLDADDSKRQMESVLRVIDEGRADEFEMRQRCKDGSEFITHLRVSPLRNEEGEIIAWVGIHRDITERKRIEEALRQSEEKYRALTENLLAGVYVIQDGKFIYANPAVQKTVGYTLDEIEKLPDQFIVIHPDDRMFVLDQLRRRLEGEKLEEPYETRLVRKDGGERRCLISGIRVDYKGKLAVLGNIIDITDRFKAEQALRESEEMFRMMGENSGDAVFLIQDEKFIYINPQVSKLSGFTEEVFLSGGLGIYDLISPESIEMVKQRHKTRIAGGEAPSQYDLDIICADGSRLNWEVKVAGFIWKGKFTTMITGRDITERKLMQQQMLFAQKAESVQRLAGGIAHDFNNLLVGILGNASLLKSAAGDDPRFINALDQVESAARQAAGLTGQLLAYARGGRYQPVPINLAALTKETLPLLKASVGDAVKIELDFPGQLPAIEADRSQFEQIILNLTLNAAEAMSFKGKLALRGDLIENDAGRWVRLHFEDTGPGLTADVMEHIFDPFFSTKETGRGMGMAVVYGIVQSHRGHIDMGNLPHGGAHFTLSFPALEVKAKEPVSQRPEEAAGKGETILIVDDEKIVRDVAKSILESHGYEVLSASSGDDAIRALAERDDIGLVLLDIVMPEMDGIEIAKEIRRDYPATKILFTSGFSKPLEVPEKEYGDGFIQKPFTAGELRAKIRRVLEGLA